MNKKNIYFSVDSINIFLIIKWIDNYSVDSNDRSIGRMYSPEIEITILTLKGLAFRPNVKDWGGGAESAHSIFLSKKTEHSI